MGVGFEMQTNGEIHLTGALGNEFSPETVLVNATAPLALAPAGTASVHGLIKTLFPVADAPAGVMVPLTSESRVLLCLPVAPGDRRQAGPDARGELTAGERSVASIRTRSTPS